MSNVIHQPHDKLFKKAMTDIRVACQFFESHLPAAILDRIDLKTLKLEKQSFIDEIFKSSEADIVYSVKIDEKLGYFYLLCEHQSRVDDHIAFRLLLYSVRLMEMHFKQHVKEPLPIIYPLVLYTGKKTWTAPQDIMDLFGDHKELAKQILFKPYFLIEVQKESDEELRRYLWSGIVKYALKHQNARDFSGFLGNLFPWLNEIEIQGGANFATTVLKYMFDNINKNNKKLLIEKADEFLSAKLRGEVMTIAEYIKQRGIQLGRKQGMQQGMQQERISVLISLLQRKFGNIPAQYMKRIQQANSETLLQCLERILEAKTLKELFLEE